MGIGTSNPQSFLSVGGNGNINAAISGLSDASHSIGVYGEGISDYDYGVFGVAEGSHGTAILGMANNGATAGYFWGKVVIYEGNLTIDGNVGIGTTSIPSVKLSLGTDINTKKLALWDGENDFYGFGVAVGRITFFTNNTEKMTIKDNGNVGINTTNPQAKLEVIGSVKVGASGIKFSELYEITGKTGTNYRTDISYPTGYTQSNTRIISYEVVDFTGPNWVSGFEGLWVALADTYIRLGHEASFFNGQSFRLLLMKVE